VKSIRARFSVSAMKALQADVILLDARMPDGAAEVRRALDAAPGLRIVVSAVRETEDDIVTWADAGVLGYIPRTTPRSDFVRLIMAIHSGAFLGAFGRRPRCARIGHHWPASETLHKSCRHSSLGAKCRSRREGSETVLLVEDDQGVLEIVTAIESHPNRNGKGGLTAAEAPRPEKIYAPGSQECAAQQDLQQRRLTDPYADE
jgi:hypothetical protein